jgi:hypothetical protein
MVSSFVKDLDTPLLRLSPQGDFFSLRDGCGGVQAFGGIGSGKSSATAKMFSGAYLRGGFGGLVTAAKYNQIPFWQEQAKLHGRSNSLVRFDENEGFNFLTYEMSLHGMDGIGTSVDCLMRIMDSAKRASPTASQRGGEPFWEDSSRKGLRYTLPPIYSAKGALSIPDIIRFISTAPTSRQETTDPAWQERSFFYQIMNAAANRPKVPMSRAALQNAINFWAEEWPNIPDKTRGNIVITITATLDRFNHGRLNRVFCGKTTVTPELTFHGAVILLAMPTTTWNEDGIIAQQLFKYMWQRSVLARNSLEEKHRERPVFLFSDEAQETVSPFDADYQSLCRESKACTVYLTQSLPNYYAKMGGDNPRDAAHSLVGKFVTNIFHANSCPETNDFASRVVGRILTRRGNFSSGNSRNLNLGMSAGNSEQSGWSSNHGFSSNHTVGQGGQSSSTSGSGSNDSKGNNWGSNRGQGVSRNESRGYSESMEYAIEPGDFARILRTGGRENGNQVTAVWFQSGRTFKCSGSNVMLQRFQQ